MRISTLVCVILGLWLLSGCTTTYDSYYPSYEITMAKYAPPGGQVALRVEDTSDYPESEECDCPQVWYENHWVYYYHGSWIFWNHGYWYYYPYFDWYYFGYGPILYEGPGRVIVSSSKPKSESFAEQKAERESRTQDNHYPAETRDNSTTDRISPPSQPSSKSSSSNQSSSSRSSSSSSSSSRSSSSRSSDSNKRGK